jgi:hypothetical protein
MLDFIKKFIKNHIDDDHDLHQDPMCSDCHDGNDQCKLYPQCRHIRENAFEMSITQEVN